MRGTAVPSILSPGPYWVASGSRHASAVFGNLRTYRPEDASGDTMSLKISGHTDCRLMPNRRASSALLSPWASNWSRSELEGLVGTPALCRPQRLARAIPVRWR